jgi:hypothetical protein
VWERKEFEVKFKFFSVFHLSLERIIVTLLEGRNSRFCLYRCNVLINCFRAVSIHHRCDQEALSCEQGQIFSSKVINNRLVTSRHQRSYLLHFLEELHGCMFQTVIGHLQAIKNINLKLYLLECSHAWAR